MYEGDSFFSLGMGGQIALVALSVLLAGLMLMGARLAARRFGRWTGLGQAMVLWWLFVWLSPQVYYLLYLALIDGLPLQVVVGRPPGPGRVIALLTLTGPTTLSEHGVGLLGWAMAALACVAARRCKV